MKMVRIITSLIYAVLLSLICFPAHAEAHYATLFHYNLSLRQDSIPKSSKKRADTAAWVNNVAGRKASMDSLNVRLSSLNPNLSLQQMLKGNVTGLYVQETTGEPGTEQSMLIRGLSAPIFRNRDINNLQPIVYVNGIPLLQNNNFIYDIQKYDFNPIGPATNLLAGIDINNIESIKIIKDPAELAILGPLAANGAIWIITKQAKSGIRQFSINSYFGLVQSGNAVPVNAEYENKFRRPFYQKYASPSDMLNYAGYLRDSTNLDYYGPAKWTDLYYKTAPIHSVDLSLTGGSERANFRFFGSNTRSAGNADGTNLDRYAASFQVNMSPYEWVTVSSVVNASRMDRNRNKSIRDRFAETRYIPDLSSPFSPNKGIYESFLNEFKKAIDDNRNSAVQGSLGVLLKLGKFRWNSKLNFDYNEGFRDVFYPTTLMEGNNYVSSYFGYNQRFGVVNTLDFSKKIGSNHNFDFQIGQSLQNDVNKYNYANAYNGPNDFIKINVINSGANYLVYPYTDREEARLFSVYGSVKYKYKDLFSITGLIRDDGSSNAQPDSRWLITPAASVQWNLKNQFLKENNWLDELNASVSWSRVGKISTDDRFAAGPQYRVDIGWGTEPTIPGYNGLAPVTRPYSSGWVGYDIKWPYVDQLNIGLTGVILNRRLTGSLTWYRKDDKRLILNTPVPTESGFASAYSSGMALRNTGLELGLSANIFKGARGIAWISALNASINKNKLTALPGGLNELVIGDRMLKVGEAIDRFWVYENKGIYQTDAAVPVNPADNQPLNYEGTIMKAGDPIWKDQNGDYTINNADKVLRGNSMPKLTGGWYNELTYGPFNLNFNFIFAVGQKGLSQQIANRFDFINKESGNNIGSIKEINSWQDQEGLDQYPVYNPWSSVVPYRLEQDLFLQNASYLKLRSVSLGYDFSKMPLLARMKVGIKRAYLYVTANNLLTITAFKGDDPELINYNGIYTGFGMAIPKTYTLGIKFDL
jgi:TonB-linked SusC/RagA family outer membrane protein